MNSLRDGSNHEKLIEDYLFSGYKPASYKSTFDVDQQFARPIEDEDIFGIASDDKIGESNFDNDQCMGGLMDDSFGVGSNNGCDTRADPQFPDTCKDGMNEDAEEIGILSNLSPCETRAFPEIDVDDLFSDDLSKSCDSNAPMPSRNDENMAPAGSEVDEAETRPRLEDPSPTKLKAMQIRQKIRDQVKAKGLVANKIGFDCDKDGMIELEGLSETPTKIAKSTKIFNNLLAKSEKLKNSPYGGRKLTNELEKKRLLKMICAKKRKVWDSFQHPTENFDEEEELVASVHSSRANSPGNSEPGSPTKSNSDQEDDVGEDPYAEVEEISDEDEVEEIGDKQEEVADKEQAKDEVELNLTCVNEVESDDDW